ncbi:hypothetical protein [Brevibacillus agri]|nr:hypothetical protein [Brevibacillus agri]MCG5253825.1 hypothetical protein [Brevibacillus agri]
MEKMLAAINSPFFSPAIFNRPDISDSVLTKAALLSLKGQIGRNDNHYH